jgi:hypothetical protein
VILSTSVNEKEQALKRAKIYIPITLFCMLFGWVYEKYSFGVYSNYMITHLSSPNKWDDFLAVDRNK